MARCASTTCRSRTGRTSCCPDLDLDIPAGETIALVGATGAGKTTIARLAARFWDPTTGRVLLDGIDVRDVGETDLRRAIAMVTQENFLFSGSVADNIGLGRPAAARDEIVAAARAIGADDFIRALPDGYDTDVHQKGARLSAGQRQLVAFARAFLADPAVLILDEATSSLDIPSERLVQRALRTLLADRTAVIIAHRLTTVEIADRVLVLEHGRVVEDGTPRDLIESGARTPDCTGPGSTASSDRVGVQERARNRMRRWRMAMGRPCCISSSSSASASRCCSGSKSAHSGWSGMTARRYQTSAPTSENT